MSSWLSKIFGHNVAKKIPKQVSQAKTVRKVAPQVEAKVDTAVTQSVKSNGRSLGSMISYGKWYYGVDPKAKPTVIRDNELIMRKYPCKDGAELVVSYVNHPGSEARLSISKTDYADKKGLHDYYKSFYADTMIKHGKDAYGPTTRTVKKKGAMKQVVSSKDGCVTEDVHVPLKRWEKDGFSKRVDGDINPRNPNDFERFADF